MFDETKQAVKALENKGYYIENMFDGFNSTLENEWELLNNLENEWELLNNKGDILMDHLTQAHIMQLAKIL